MLTQYLRKINEKTFYNNNIVSEVHIIIYYECTRHNEKIVIARVLSS